MIIAMPTVPHSGTHFLRSRVLNKDGLFACISPADNVNGGNFLITAHYDEKYILPWQRLVARWPTVIIMRHPARTREAYARRNVIGATNLNYIHQWDSLIALSVYFVDVLYLHVDVEHKREYQADKIQDRFGIKKGVDWSLGADTNTKSGTADWDIPADDDTPKRFIDFYERTK